ncbi:UNKNOWN [Stylonychia lemnae]|uniref:Uncharacterized protein n=1 Tax=Stylonychia lemnae TaxID=5949 RepID=A0A078BA86_STYLE|nr:UNKNOWN [Stylonychia lemnae]|eukprot:CDW91324.1 UNKNOWN [Stylonychia lemnae]
MIGAFKGYELVSISFGYDLIYEPSNNPEKLVPQLRAARDLRLKAQNFLQLSEPGIYMYQVHLHPTAQANLNIGIDAIENTPYLYPLSQFKNLHPLLQIWITLIYQRS